MSLLSQQSSRHPSVEQLWLLLPSIFAPAPWQPATRGLTTFTQLEECIRWVELIGLQPCSDQRYRIKIELLRHSKIVLIQQQSLNNLHPSGLQLSIDSHSVLFFTCCWEPRSYAIAMKKCKKRFPATLSATDITRVGTLKRYIVELNPVNNLMIWSTLLYTQNTNAPNV